MRSLRIVQSSVGLGDPHICSDARDRRAILSALYESLMRRDPAGEYIPCLAEHWHIAADARTWTFQLRAGVRCHNGATLTAYDAVASLERICDPQLGGELGTQGVYLSYLAGSRFSALNDHTLQIVTAVPLADLLDLLVDMPIVPQSALADLPGVPVGSGPYQLVETKPGQLTMAAFAQYWGTPAPTDRLIWEAEPDPAQRATLVRAGAADLATALGPNEVAQLETAGHTCPAALSGLCVIVMLNMQSGPCTDLRIRQALNYATNQQEIVAVIKQGAAEPLNGPLTRLHMAYDPGTSPYAYNPDRARQLLAEAGYDRGLDLSFDIPTIYPDEAIPLAALLQTHWAQVGIRAQIRTHPDRPGYADMVRAKQIGDACLFDSSPLSSMRVLYEKIHSQRQGPWWQGYQNYAVDQLIDQASTTVDFSQRQGLYQQAYRQIHADAPWIFLYSPTLRYGLSRQLADWRPGADGIVRMT